MIIAILLTGIGFILYPTLSDYWNKFQQSRAVVEYSKTVKAFDDDVYRDMWQKAVKYNEQLYKRVFGKPVEDEPVAYSSVLNVTEAGMMAYIDIPKIKVHLPIMHTVDEGVLQSNVGHMELSSLPVGGENTHCVLSGHTGLPSARLLTDLEMIRVNDIFTITVLGEILTYQVDQILVVNPWEADDIRIIEGGDYCTLVTCTPYGVNSHRLLVRGKRIETTKETIEVVKKIEETEKIKTEPFFIVLFIAGLIILVVIIITVISFIISRRKAKKRKKEKENEGV